MWKQLLAYLLFGLGFLTVTFFKRYTGVLIPHPFLFYLLGLALFAAGYFLLRTSSSKELKQHQQKTAAVINDLKTNGERIQVNLLQCDIREHNYTEEREKEEDAGDLALWGFEHTLSGTTSALASRGTEQVQVVQSVIIYNHRNARTGQTEKFISRVIAKDQVTLGFYLEQQKQTYLYVDRSDRRRYYFDLGFLEA